MGEGRSIVEYFYENGEDRMGNRCGYCHSNDSGFSKGMWGHQVSCQDYQDLIDRGWRRSGKYLYKPTMKKTCCPLYTIRCDALNFKPSKSHKKVMKQVTKFLTNKPKDLPEGPAESVSNATKKSKFDKQTDITSKEEAKKTAPGRASAGPDPDRPPCRKAKVIRKEKWLEKHAATGVEGTKEPVKRNEGKSLEDFLSDHLPSTESAHKLECVLIKCDQNLPEFQSSYQKSFELFCKYQKDVHKDKPEKLKEKRYKRFLVDSPLVYEKSASSPSTGWGSFHQQYYIDGKLVAVGVMDILPNCVSSVYFYYDTDYSFLSPGVYSSLRELYFTIELNKTSANLKYYYMGFYTHSCPKMTYKAKYSPSYLVCPESYSWIPVERCLPKLDTKKYSRLDETDKEDPVVDIKKVVVLLSGHGLMPYSVYKTNRPGSNDDEEVHEYAQLVGPKVSTRMALYRT